MALIFLSQKSEVINSELRQPWYQKGNILSQADQFFYEFSNQLRELGRPIGFPKPILK